MNFFELEKHKMSFFASCPLFLESLLLDEINTIKVKTATPVRGGVEFEAYNEKVVELILSSRFASRVFKKYYSFQVQNEKEFSNALREVKWRAIFNVNLRFKIMTHVGGDVRDYPRAFQNTLYLTQLTKDAVVDHFKRHENFRPTVDTKNPEVTIYIHVTPFGKGLKIDVLMDLCGDPLSDRGLRPFGRSVAAPLRENLAAALVKLTEWNPKQERFVDLMCGSGTVLAEAYMMAKNIAPSFKKVQLYLDTKDQIFAFQNLLWFQKDQYLIKNFEILVDKISENIPSKLKIPQKLKGIDIHADAVQATRSLFDSLNADKDVEIVKADATTYSSNNQKEILFCNPPYGIRLEKDEPELEDLYYQLGEQWKNHCKGTRAFIFTANLPLLKKVSLKPSKKWELFNGQLPAKLVEYHLY
jgi:putative N6-adenine-specific DNA methylase